MKHLCIIYNFAQKYREAIYREIDKAWECDWYFGSNDTDIEGFDLSALKRATLVNNTALIKPFYFQNNIIRLLVEKKYDTYLMLGEFNCISTWIMLLIKPLIARNKKIFLWTHGWYGREGKLKKLLKHIFFRQADGIFLYGNYAKKLMIEEGFPEDRLFVIHNSLDYENQKALRERLDSFSIYKDHFKNENPNLIFVGRLTPIKRIDMLLEAMKILIDKDFYVNLTLIGDGSKAEELKSMTKRLGLEERVWFYGACYDDSKNASLIYNADLCVAPGNVGLTAMHTMAFGTPVLTHDNFPMQMPEFEAIIENRTGAFFKYGNVESLAEEISRWIERHKSDRESVRAACYNEIESAWNTKYQMNVLKDNLR